MKVSEITEFLENAYDILNAKYFEGGLSKVVITVQSSPKAYGHYTTYEAWTDSNSGFKEINISAENLDRPIENIIATLIHEMVHHFCAIKGIQDCSRGGTYHNKRFREQAEKRGLKIDYDTKIGFSITSPSEELIEFVEEMGWGKLNLSRRDESEAFGGDNGISGSGGNLGKTKKPTSTRKYICPICHNSVRATKNVNIGCLDCGGERMIIAE